MVAVRRGGRWGAWILVTIYLVLGLAIPIAVTLGRSVAIDPFWQAYTEQLSSSSILTILARTLLLAALCTLLTVLVSYPVAYAITLMGRRGRIVLLAALVLPSFAPFLVRAYAWIGIMAFNGPLVSVMEVFGIASTGFNYTVVGVLIVLVHSFAPIMILTCFVTMSRIDPSHLRAARTLGANHLESFWRVYAPQTKSGLLAGAALVFISSVGIYVTPALIGTPDQSTVTTLVVRQVLNSVFGISPAYPAALSVVLAVVVAFVLLLAGRWIGLAEVLGLKNLQGADARTTQLEAKTRVWRPRRTMTLVLRHVPVGNGRHHFLVGAMVGLAVLLVDAPFIYLIGMSFQPLPILEFPTRDWSTIWYTAVFTDPAWGEATRQSVKIALLATALALVVGTFLALRTRRLRPVARGVVIAAALVPLVMPYVMYATGIFTVFTRLGLIGNWQAIAVVHSVLALPYVYVNVLNGLNSYDPRWDQAAASLGASPGRRLLKITVPLLRPSLITGAFLAILLSIDEVTVTIFMGGVAFENLPLKYWAQARQELSPELAAIGVLLIGVIICTAALAAVAASLTTRRSATSSRSNQQ